MIKKLISKRLLVESNDVPVGHLPAKSVDLIMLSDVIHAARSAGEGKHLSIDAIKLPQSVLAVANGIDESVEKATHGRSVRGLVVEEDGDNI
jgi:membrane protein